LIKPTSPASTFNRPIFFQKDSYHVPQFNNGILNLVRKISQILKKSAKNFGTDFIQYLGQRHSQVSDESRKHSLKHRKTIILISIINAYTKWCKSYQSDESQPPLALKTLKVCISIFKNQNLDA